MYTYVYLNFANADFSFDSYIKKINNVSSDPDVIGQLLYNITLEYEYEDRHAVDNPAKKDYSSLEDLHDSLAHIKLTPNSPSPPQVQASDYILETLQKASKEGLSKSSADTETNSNFNDGEEDLKNYKRNSVDEKHSVPTPEDVDIDYSGTSFSQDR